mmetsp:Transcript_4708/g.8146  ORF Transcript_4708/g.8146 Transcript_4708/m.8146 type:complete len:109 (-) Transcript_4708:758-1084(-)
MQGDVFDELHAPPPPPCAYTCTICSRKIRRGVRSLNHHVSIRGNEHSLAPDQMDVYNPLLQPAATYTQPGTQPCVDLVMCGMQLQWQQRIGSLSNITPQSLCPVPVLN